MSSETDHPRQRTVAELLAQHGDVNATGRRRRRREPDGLDDDGAAPVGNRGAAPVPDGPAPARGPDRPALREPMPPGQREPGRRRAPEPEPWDAEPRSWDSQPAEAGWEPQRPPEPPAWDAGPQPWESGRQGWESSDWDAPPPADRWDDRPREREPHRWELEPPASGPPGWDSAPDAPDAWDPRPWEPSSPGPPAREPRSWEPGEPVVREPRPREPRLREPPLRQPREPQPREPQPREPQPREPQLAERPPRAAGGPRPVGERPTDHIPRIREDAPPDGSLTGPIQPHLVRDRRGADDAFDAAGYDAAGYDAAGYDADGYESDGYEQDGYEPDDGGPSTMVGAAPVGAEAWHRERTHRRAAAADDGGPPTEAAAPLDFDDPPAGLGGHGYNDAAGDSDGFDDFYGTGQHEAVRPPPVHQPLRNGRRGPARGGRDEPYAPDELEHDGFLDGVDDDEFEPADDDRPAPRRRLLERVTDTSGQTWAAVLAQWIAGAVGGAALWVGFRFLWQSLPVVAIAAAALVTVGLVVVVRALLRNDDMRTTMFAVLVGLLLTVSPAILVLIGR